MGKRENKERKRKRMKGMKGRKEGREGNVFRPLEGHLKRLKCVRLDSANHTFNNL